MAATCRCGHTADHHAVTGFYACTRCSCDAYTPKASKPVAGKDALEQWSYYRDRYVDLRPYGDALAADLHRLRADLAHTIGCRDAKCERCHNLRAYAADARED